MRHLSLFALPAVLSVGLCPCAAPAQSSVELATAQPDSNELPVPAKDSPAPVLPAEPVSVSQVRIVRLSEMRGEVELDRGTGRGYQPAFTNIPITTGTRIKSGTGLAEVEFEDNSTLRIAPDSELRFTELGRSATGATLTRVTLEKGMVYVTRAKTPGAFFVLAAGESTLRPSAGSHLRLDIASSPATLSVLNGTVDFTGPTGSTTVAKKQTLVLGDIDHPAIEIVAKVSPAPFDSWDKQGDDYQKRYATAAFSGGSGALFGSSDLNYYGSFADMPGCGSLWRPYFASASWSPFAVGTLAMYPGAGYSFISPYPWGWLPFHSGSWQQCGAAGWGWSPNGGGWSGLQNIAATGTQHTLRRLPVKSPAGHAPLVPIGVAAVQASHLTTPGTFTFVRDSAGLGVPRDAFGKLNHASVSVARHGRAETEAGMNYVAVPSLRTSAAGRTPAAPMRSLAMITRASASFSNGTAGLSPSFSGVSSLGSSSRSLGSPSAVSHGAAGTGSAGSPGGGAHH